MGWLLVLAGVVVVLSVIAYGPGWRRGGRYRRGAPDGPGERVVREAERARGQGGWGLGGPAGGGGGGGYS
jgi:hypothetical protein